MDKPLWVWGLFLGVVIALMVLDLGVLHRKEKEISVRESLKMTAFYILMGLSFGGFVWFNLGAAKANEYITGYLVELTLSMDNIFVMSLIFSYFSIPTKYQHRVLFWGIIGVLLLRGITIAAGTAIVERFDWVLLLFAGFLVVTGIKMLMIAEDEEKDFSKSKLLKWLKRHLPITDTLHERKFSVLLPHAENPNKQVRYYTPLFLALVMIEFADLIFAMDSIPAIFAITLDPYIVYTSNIFAILGLRSMYFALAAIVSRFHYLKYVMAMLLVFIGGKVLAADLLGMDKIPSSVSLFITVLLLGGGIGFSMLRKPRG